MDLNTEEVWFIIEFYFRTDSCNVVCKKFCEWFGGTRSLHNTMVKHVVEWFQNKHSVEWCKGSGLTFSLCTTAPTEDVRELVQENWRMLVSKLARHVGISATSMHRTLQRMNLYPYRIAILQQLYLNESSLAASKPGPTPSHPNFFLWSYVENKVFEHNPGTIDELKVLITEAIITVTPAMLKQIFHNMQEHVEACLCEKRHHFEYML